MKTFILIAILFLFSCKEAILNHPAEGAGGILVGVNLKNNSAPTTPSIIASGTGNNITEGKSRIVSIKLSSGITTDLPVTITSSNKSITIDDSASQTITLTPSDATIDHEVILSAVVDDNLLSETAVVKITAPGLSEISFSVKATDKDTQNISVGGATSVNEGGTPVNIAVLLTKIPNADVTVNITSENTSAVTVSPTTLTFTPANYSIPQLVAVSALTDVNLVNDVVPLTFTATGIPTATYNITAVDMNLVATPTFSLPAGFYSSPQYVTFNSTTSGANIYYTLDGTTPTTSSSLYTEPIHIYALAGHTIKAFATKPGNLDSGVATLNGIYSYPPLKTGQTSCYDASNVAVPCGSYPGQDGQENQGVARSYILPTAHPTYTSDYTTTDNATGLVWRSCPQGQSGAFCQIGTIVTLTWDNALIDPTNGSNALNSANSGNGYAGKTNWRLPILNELLYLFDGGKTVTPVYNTNAFPGTIPLPWSSSVVYTVPTNAWSGVINFGSTITSAKTAINVHVRCVSGPPLLMQQAYTDNGDGTCNCFDLTKM